MEILRSYVPLGVFAAMGRLVVEAGLGCHIRSMMWRPRYVNVMAAATFAHGDGTSDNRGGTGDAIRRRQIRAAYIWLAAAGGVDGAVADGTERSKP